MTVEHKVSSGRPFSRQSLCQRWTEQEC